MAENCPLVIDQPEDNLDNRLIGNVIIQVLASLKEKRQIIVSTHNANLVVGGDAEQVIVFDTEDGYCTKTADGSIDSEPVVNSVLGIMEGGKEAFDARRVRYGI
jgi:predicted ATPase